MKVRALLGSVAVAIVVAAAGPSTAHAGRIIECGSFELGYGMRVSDMTTRNVPCFEARRQIYREWDVGGIRPLNSPFWSSYMQKTCRVRRTSYRSWDSRCVLGSQVIRWQHYAATGRVGGD